MITEVKVNDYIFKVQIDLDVSYNSKSNELEVVNCSAKTLERIKSEDTSDVRHRLTETQFNFGILTLGSKGIGSLMPLNESINVKLFVNDVLRSEKLCNTHSSSKGRVNGLTKIYKDNNDVINSNSIIKVDYNPSEKELKIMV